jgi:hypothetical protein
MDTNLDNQAFPVQPFDFNDFDSPLARPLGRLGASRPPAAEEGIPEEASPRARFEELFFTLSSEWPSGFAGSRTTACAHFSTPASPTGTYSPPSHPVVIR